MKLEFYCGYRIASMEVEDVKDVPEGKYPEDYLKGYIELPKSHVYIAKQPIPDFGAIETYSHTDGGDCPFDLDEDHDWVWFRVVPDEYTDLDLQNQTRLLARFCSMAQQMEDDASDDALLDKLKEATNDDY